MKLEEIEAFPLTWPVGRPRTKSRTRARFHRKYTEQKRWSDGSTSNFSRSRGLTIAESRDLAMDELQKLGATMVVISSNLRLRIDGLPVSAQREPEDPGVAIYFQMKGNPHCLSCDAWDRAADNLAAIAKHVEAMRGQLRWGVADIAAMFAGFKALPASAAGTSASIDTPDQAAAFLAKFGQTKAEIVLAQPDTAKKCYLLGANKLHPDHNNGQQLAEWNLLTQAWAVMQRHHAKAGA